MDIAEVGSWALIVIVALLILYFIRFLLRIFVPKLNRVFFMSFQILCFPFRFLNGFQRHFAKPWHVLYKSHRGSDGFNKFVRGFWNVLKLPFYFVLAPVRLANAVFYNIIVHVGFEAFNYLMEICVPSTEKEGQKDFFTWLMLIPYRVVKYLWHFLLTIVESIIWTIIDVFVPALTLYHGTGQDISEIITQSPGRLQSGDKFMGLWKVGGGNFAGNGIYFAPVRKTAEHYARCNSKQALIVCRVSLGKVLDLGMAPNRIYSLCGHSNATDVTRWGLDHGFTTGEWWRGDESWWEYCMYDWQNRYTPCWRIRPLYVEDLNGSKFYPIPGGMVHWLFRKIVIDDLRDSISSKK